MDATGDSRNLAVSVDNFAAQLDRWIMLLHGHADLTLRDSATSPPQAGRFSDEAGFHRPVDPYLLRAAGHPSEGPTAYAGDMSDVRLWSEISHPSDFNIDTLLRPDDRALLLSHSATTTIEVRTESELCALHALWSLARLRGRRDWRQRCLNAASWHLAEMQPDNATGLPWAIHLFIILALDRSLPAAMIDAETRLHNSLVSSGRPDRRSAWILRHAALELERLRVPTLPRS